MDEAASMEAIKNSPQMLQAQTQAAQAGMQAPPPEQQQQQQAPPQQ